ncbi:MAG TPA: hypothetical protein VGL09_00090 [Methylomirabilota bacterium]|jgi:hypothetical protein
MSDLWRRERAFSGWHRDDCNRLAGELAEIIAETAFIGVVVGIEHATLSSYLAKFPGAVDYLGGVYSICVEGAMNLTSKALDQIDDESGVHYFFEDGAEGKAEAMLLLDKIASNEVLSRRFRRRGDTFLPKGDNAATGAADFLAWEWQNLYKAPGPDVFPTLMRLIESRVRHFRLGYTEPNIVIQEGLNRFYGVRLRL